MPSDLLDRDPTLTDTPARPSRSSTWALRGAIALASVGLCWVVAPEAVRASVSGPGPLLRVLAVGVALVVVSRVIVRLVPNRVAGRILALVPVLAVSWWALSPYVGDDVVDEAFPVAAGAPLDDSADSPVDDVAATPAAGTDGAAAPADEAAAGEAAAGDAPTDDAAAPIAGSEAAETGSDLAPPNAPEPATETSGGTSSAATPTAEAPAPTVAPPSGPVALGAGTFQGLTGHRGAGTATIYELEDGSRVLRLEDFDVSNGPDLQVHLVPGADQRGPGGGIQIADLKGNVGNQNYDLPADLDLTGTWTVLIWCEPFTVEVANATLDLG